MPPEQQNPNPMPSAPQAQAPYQPQAQAPVQTNNLDRKATTALTLGIIGLVAWLIPIIGLIVSLIGLITGIKALKSNKRSRAKVAITLSIIGLFLTVVNGAIGAYMGATGQHSVVNEMMNQ